MCLLLFGICASQLSKFPFVYYAVLFFYVFALVRQRNVLQFLSVRFTLMAVAAGILSLGLLYLLYRLQYGENLAARAMSGETIFTLLWYRPFFAVNDALHLWFEVFPERHSYVGLSGIGLLAALGISGGVADPTTLVPVIVMGDRLTTLQTGFMGSGYAAFGLAGLILYSLVTGILVWMMSELPFRFTNAAVRAAGLAVLGLNMYFLTTRQLHTALLSGGLLSTTLLFVTALLLMRLVRVPSLARSPAHAPPWPPSPSEHAARGAKGLMLERG